MDKLRATNEGHGVKNAVLHLYSPMDVRVYHELKQPDAEGESANSLNSSQAFDSVIISVNNNINNNN